MPRTPKVSFPGESAEYRAARDRLLERQAALRHAMEAVAAARRELPPGGRPRTSSSKGPGPDRSPTPVRMSELFARGRDTLLIYSFMFGPDREESCRMCTGFLSLLDPRLPRQIADGLDPDVLRRAGYPEIPPPPVNLVVDTESVARVSTLNPQVI